MEHIIKEREEPIKILKESKKKICKNNEMKEL